MPVITLTKSNVTVKDTYLYQDAPTGNYATSSVIAVGNTPTAVERALLKFDLGLIPNDVIVNSATLKLVMHSNVTASRIINLHPITSDWVDTTATWNIAPSFDINTKASITVPTVASTLDVDVTNIIQKMVNDNPNNGFLLKDSDETSLNSNILFHSTKSTITAKQPTLTIDYTIPTTKKKQVEYVGNDGDVFGNTIDIKIPIPSRSLSGDLLVVQAVIAGDLLELPTGWDVVLNHYNTSTQRKHIMLTKFKSDNDGNELILKKRSTGYYLCHMHLFRNVKAISQKNSGAAVNSNKFGIGKDIINIPEKSMAVLMNTATTNVFFTNPLNFYTVGFGNSSEAGSVHTGVSYCHDKTSYKMDELTSVSSNSTYGYSTILILEPINNNVPTLTLTSPTNNQLLTEGNVLSIEGSVSDADNGNVVTTKYRINAGPVRAIASGVSDGSTPILFAKTLKYSNKRLLDGTTDIVGIDLAENTDHTLTVWSEDDQGGKSAEVTRTFRVVWNRPPVISGTNEDLGVLTASPSLKYSANDPEGDAFTISEKVNGKVIRTFPGESGVEYTVTIPNDAWLRLSLIDVNTLTVEATDSNGLTSVRAYTFRRTADKIAFQLAEPFITDIAAKRMIVSIDATIPTGADYTVEVTNNAFDTEPTWENATAAAKFNQKYLFENTEKTADEWGVNLRMEFTKGIATEFVVIRGFGGAFD
ncbi:DNRLRE domain-containing protein [Brevibacillus daliensis]|uniref:DNRLRE domain-containing protein n=1 Tax=Brevibacillus daliensis TaxID=2892995 RepID=UPI001E2ED175|nr:DNRLRE domain-containing protein [Brevibacillus daliensis]